MSDIEAREVIAKVYDEYAHRVYGYSLRSCIPADAEDVVAEVFAVAWRRCADLPDEPLPWLLATARNVISDRRRSDVRRARLLTQWSEQVRQTEEPADEVVVHRQLMLAALSTLTSREREALLLVAWDGLTTDQAAAVVGCSSRAFRARLTRARARLEAALNADMSPSLHNNLPQAEGIPT